MIPSTKSLKQTKANGVVLKDAYICGNYKEMYLTKFKVLPREDVEARGFMSVANVLCLKLRSGYMFITYFLKLYEFT